MASCAALGKFILWFLRNFTNFLFEKWISRIYRKISVHVIDEKSRFLSKHEKINLMWWNNDWKVWNLFRFSNKFSKINRWKMSGGLVSFILGLMVRRTEKRNSFVLLDDATDLPISEPILIFGTRWNKYQFFDLKSFNYFRFSFECFSNSWSRFEDFLSINNYEACDVFTWIKLHLSELIERQYQQKNERGR